MRKMVLDGCAHGVLAHILIQVVLQMLQDRLAVEQTARRLGGRAERGVHDRAAELHGLVELSLGPVNTFRLFTQQVAYEIGLIFVVTAFIIGSEVLGRI